MFSARYELWSDSSLHFEGWLYDPIILALLRDCTSEVGTLGLILHHCNTICALFYHLLPCCFYCSHYKNSYLLSILHFYHHLFTELVHLYNFPLYWVCWGHKIFLVFDWRVARERLSSSNTSHGLINLRSSTWGKIDAVLQNSAVGVPTRVYKNKVA